MLEVEAYKAMCARAQGTNVHERTLLATDYLNHFNEAVMLLEMLPDMPDLAEELAEWHPKSYVDHFRDSGIADRELAIDAYPYSPEAYRLPFEFTIRGISRQITGLREEAGGILQSGNTEQARVVIMDGLQRIHALMGAANAIIHGCARRNDLRAAAASDSAPPPPEVEVASDPADGEEEIMDQGSIDALFE